MTISDAPGSFTRRPSDPVVRRELRERRERLASVLIDPPFAIYGLDASWPGRRWLAGVSSTDGVVRRIELGHGEPGDLEAPEIRVATRHADVREHEWAWAARELVHGLWHDGMDHTSALRAPFTDDPTAGWEEVSLLVDGNEVRFHVLEAAPMWAALGMVADQTIVTLQGRHADLAAVRLSLVDDTAPYRGDDGILRQF